MGPNNAGKSTLERFFREFRRLFTPFGDNLNRGSLFRHVFNEAWGHHFAFEGPVDQTEVFHGGNIRPLVVDVEVPDAESYTQGAQCLQRISFHFDRNSPGAVRILTLRGGNPAVDLSAQRISGHPNALPDVLNEFTLKLPPRRRAELDSKVVFREMLVDCRDIIEAFTAFARARYYGPFRNAINQGSGNYFDLQVGSAFTKLWDGWKTGGARQQMRAVVQVTDDIRSLFGFRRLEVNANPAKDALVVTVDGEPYRLAELGAGISQFIIALGNAAIDRPALLLIDEPETNLHPSLQTDFLLTLANYATVGVVFSTHSIGLARSIADRIYSVQKGAKGSLIREFEATTNYAEFVGELSFSAFKDLGSDSILLVEGVHDVRTAQQWLRLYGREHCIVILPLGGSAMITGGREQELCQLRRLSTRISVLIDSERERAGGPLHTDREAFIASCEKLGFRSCLTERRAIENYFTVRAVRSAFGKSFTALAEYQSLKDHTNGWSKADNWRVARQMVPEELDETDVGRFLASL